MISLGLILSLLVVFATSSQGSAQSYNFSIDSTKVYNVTGCPFTTNAPVDPKISCDPTGSNCVSLNYDNCYFTGVRALWSVDKFVSQPTAADEIVNMPGTLGANFYDWYATNGSMMPYDIEFYQINADLGAFYMIFGNDVYVAFTSDPDGGGPGLPLPKVYTPGAPLVAGDQIFGHTINFDCAAILTTPINWAGLGYSCTSGNIINGFKFQEDNATDLWGLSLCGAGKTGPTDTDGILCEFRYDPTNSTGAGIAPTTISALDYTLSCSAALGASYDNISVQTFWDGSSTWRRRVETQVDYCVGTVNKYIIDDNLPSPQQYWNQRFFGGSLYYRNVSGANLSGDILRSSTPDFVSYGSPIVVYTEAADFGESVNQSDSHSAGSSNLLIWERKSVNDTANDGIWVQREDNYPISVDSDVDAPVSINLWCNDTGVDYSDSGSGQSFDLNTICGNNNRLIFTGSNRPLSYTDWVDIPSQCLTDGFNIAVLYAETPVNHTITVRDEENNLPLPNVNVTIDGTTKLSDINGQAWFDIQQISASTLERVNVSECLLRYSTDGTPTSTFMTADRAGYVDVVTSIPAPTKEVIGGFNVWTLSSASNIYMRETGMFWNLDIKASSGVVVEPCNYVVNISGPDNTWVVNLVNAESVGHTSVEFPATFKFNHSSSPVNVTATLRLPDGSLQYLYRDFTYDEVGNDTFYVPFSADDLPCFSSSPCVYVNGDQHTDCPDSFCLNQFHYKISPSVCDINSTCSYGITDCFIGEFCDDLVGCFDADTSESCLQDADCENSCLSNTTLIWGKCGADGLCKNVTTPCTEGCNSTLDEPMCNELASCELGETFRAVVYLQTGTVATGPVQTDLVGGNVNCDIDNVGEKTCLPFSTSGVAKSTFTFYGQTIDDVFYTPIDWQYVDTGDWYNWTDISVTCNETCSPVYEVCTGSCDAVTGECIEGSSIQRGLFNTLPNWLQWLLAPMFLWTMLALIIGAVLTFLPSKISQNAQPTPEIGLAAMFVWFIIGLGLGFVDPLIGLLILIGLGLALAKMLSGMLGS